VRSAWKVPNMRSQMMSRPPWFLRPVGVASLCCIVVMGGQQMSMAGAEAGAGTEGGPPQQQRQLDRLQQCRGRRAVGSLAAVVAGVVDAVVAGVTKMYSMGHHSLQISSVWVRDCAAGTAGAAGAAGSR
jgi:hypothetical protein